MSMIAAAPLLVFPALVTIAGLKDLTSYTIPNWISAVLAVAFFPAALVLGLSAATIGLHAAIGVGALVGGMVMFALGWIGGGDAKLFAAAGLWLGWPAGAEYLVLTAIFGGALAVGLLGLRSIWVRPHLAWAPAWLGRLAEPGESVPYGVAIALGGMVAFPASSLMEALGRAF